MRTISLGFSCQTRFAIDEVSADHRRMPFDFLITTRDGLLAALHARGATLAPDPDALSVFTMPKEQRQGPEAGGLYFWHDYRMVGSSLAPAWRETAAQVSEKYRSIWARFEAVLLDPAEPKRLVLSNTRKTWRNSPRPTSSPNGSASPLTSMPLSSQRWTTWEPGTTASSSSGAASRRRCGAASASTIRAFPPASAALSACLS